MRLHEGSTQLRAAHSVVPVYTRFTFGIGHKFPISVDENIEEGLTHCVEGSVMTSCRLRGAVCWVMYVAMYPQRHEF